jgi:hypothetical protein
MNTCSTVQKCNSFFHSDVFAMIMPRDREADKRQCLPIYLISIKQIGPDMQVHQRLYWSIYLYIFYHNNLAREHEFWHNLWILNKLAARNMHESTATFLTGHREGWFCRFARRLPPGLTFNVDCDEFHSSWLIFDLKLWSRSSEKKGDFTQIRRIG